MDLLLIDDSPTDRLVMQTRLQRALPGVEVHVVGESSEFTEVLKRDNCDVVITDYWLGWGDGLSVLQRVRKRWPRCRVIFLTGNGGEEVVAEAFKFGLFYYLLKPDGFENLVTVARTALDAKRREDGYELQSSVLASVADAVYSVDAAGIVTTWNAGAERIFGHPAATIIGKVIDTLVPAQMRSEVRRVYLRVLRGEAIAPLQTAGLRADGGRMRMEISMAPVRNDRGAISGVACVARESGAERPAEDSTSPHWRN
jgi:PAS domain S-box-containing protein